MVLAAITLWVSAQVLIPFRHWLYPGPVNWTEEGHRFSWHMKLRDKQGSSTFLLTDPVSGETETIDPAESLTPRQARLVAVHPEFALRYARHLADVRVRAGRPRPVVQVRGEASLNGRKGQPLIDPSVDLASVDAPPLAHWPWVLPLTEPLKADHSDAGQDPQAGDAGEGAR